VILQQKAIPIIINTQAMMRMTKKIYILKTFEVDLVSTVYKLIAWIAKSLSFEMEFASGEI
jgi:hypothetical protein